MDKGKLLRNAFGMALIFTAIDTVVHATFEPLELYHYPIHLFGIQSPLANYAISKLFSSTILLFILFLVLNRTALRHRTHARYQVIILTLIALLEVRYILGGEYTATWHAYNFVNHYVALLIGVYVIERIWPGVDG